MQGQKGPRQQQQQQQQQQREQREDTSVAKRRLRKLVDEAFRRPGVIVDGVRQ
jgi:hypothetical protein